LQRTSLGRRIATSALSVAVFLYVFGPSVSSLVAGVTRFLLSIASPTPYPYLSYLTATGTGVYEGGSPYSSLELRVEDSDFWLVVGIPLLFALAFSGPGLHRGAYRVLGALVASMIMSCVQLAIYVEGRFVVALQEAGLGLVPAWRVQAMTAVSKWSDHAWSVAYIVAACLVLAQGATASRGWRAAGR
jgi:hypothetical protein